jgi:hypothetical protein
MIPPVSLEHAAAIRQIGEWKVKLLGFAADFESALADPHIHHLPDATRAFLDDGLALLYRAVTALHSAEERCWTSKPETASGA